MSNRESEIDGTLARIVVEVSRDKEEGSGTGFYISEDEIATCYHVLAPEGEKLKENEVYWIRNDARDKNAWQKAILIKALPLPDDIAILRTKKTLDAFGPELLRPWDKVKCNFLSRGYVEETDDAGSYANDIDGKIKTNYIWIYEEKSRRLQLQTPPEAIKRGRSGSPVFSLAQKAIVGMIDYQGGELHRDAQIGAAIPIEAIVGFDNDPEGTLFYVPSLPLNFIPRNPDLEKAKMAVLPKTSSSAAITGIYRCVGLQGMGGVGKSVLACALARESDVRRFFRDGIVWIGLGQQAKQSDLVHGQIRLIRVFDPEHGPVADIASGRIEIERILSKKRCLIVLDDVWRMDHLWAFDCLGPGCRLLLTTRNQQIVRNSEAKECCLEVLSSEESLDLLRLWSGRKDLPPQARDVARECDNLPLALAMVGAMVKGRPDDRWESALHRLRSANLEKIRAEFRDYPYPNLMKAIEISTEALEAHQKSLYFDLAVFPEDETVPEAALQVLWNLDQYDTQEMIDLFVDRSLATLKDGMLSIHNLQHDFMTRMVCDIFSIHERLLEGYKRRCKQGWATASDDGYLFQHLVYHLYETGKLGELKELLLDYNWVQARLKATDVPSLLSDYDYLSSQEEIRLIQGAIRLSAHVLFRDARQLPSQLTGRLLDMHSHSLRSFIELMSLNVSYPWLRPMTESLTPPGGPLIGTLEGHAAEVTTVAISSDGRVALSGSYDNTLKLWDLETGKEVRTLKGHAAEVTAVAISSDSKLALSGSYDKTLKLWDLETWSEVKTLKGHSGEITTVAISSDGKFALSGSFDKTLKLWDLKTGRGIRTLKGHSGGVTSAAISSDGRLALSGSFDCTLKLWDLETGKEIMTLKGHIGGVRAVAICSDSKFALSGSYDKTLKLWDLKTGSEIRTLKGHDGWVTTVAISSGNKLALSGSYDKTLKLWNLKTGSEIRTLKGHADRINAVTISSCGQQALSGSYDNTLKLWDLETGKEARTLKGHADWVTTVVISSDRRLALSGSYDKTLKLWDLETGKEVRTLKGHDGWVTTVAISSGGQLAISGSYDKTLKLWDLETGKEIRTLKGHDGWVTTVAISSDGKLALSGSYDKTLKLWDLKTGREVRTLKGHADRINAVTISSDGRVALSGSYDNVLKLWDLKTGSEIRTLKGHADWVTAVAISSDGRVALSGSYDKTLKLWDLKTGREIRTLEGHASRVTTVTISSDGRLALSGSYDNTLKLWNLETGQILAQFSGEGAIAAIALAEERWIIAAGESSGQIHFLILENPPI